MILATLDRAGGEDYLLEQATANPKAFMSLLARIIPAQVTGANGKDLIPEPAAVEARVLVLLIKAGLSETEARRAIDVDSRTADYATDILDVARYSGASGTKTIATVPTPISRYYVASATSARRHGASLHGNF